MKLTINKKNKLLIISLIIIFSIFNLTKAFSQTQTNQKSLENVPDKGIQITLSVYSGRENPTWWLTSQEELTKIVSLVNSLKISSDSIFNYNEWNQLGYASFWIDPKGLDKLPVAIHVWRNMAYVIVDKKSKTGYAINADNLYKILVDQAEKRGLDKFFINYRKTQ
jgi:hypothetical protein